ncbi:molybdate ABC transporter permease subunit [Georgenia sp. Z1344]|uniref:molybdate ABC transporter permease subunit n=1 Tax=Georgenia sp. Z1344 TaxID=3416706 RepID=UPI003CE7C7CD
MTRTSSPRPAAAPPSAAVGGAGRHPAVVAVGLLGLACLVVPLLGLVSRVDWAGLPETLRRPDLLEALWLSLRTSATAAVVTMLLGVPLALWLSGQARLAPVARLLVLLPLTLPPVVAGLALVATIGRNSPVGAVLGAIGLDIGFTTTAVVLAQVFVALPYVVVTVESALRVLDPAPADAARALGAGRWTVLVRIILPAVAPAIVTGAALAAARALGEFGATLTFAGSLPGETQTMPTAIYLSRVSDPEGAYALALVLILTAIVLIGSGMWLAGRLAAGGSRRGVEDDPEPDDDDRVPLPTARPSDADDAVGSPRVDSPSAESAGGSSRAEPSSAESAAKGAGAGTDPGPVGLDVRVAHPVRDVDVEVTVPAGSVVAVVGPNGAGKSTFVSALAGLLPDAETDVRAGVGSNPAYGTDEADGTPATNGPAGAIAPRTALLSQNPGLLVSQRAVDAVALGPRIRGARTQPAREQARAALRRVGAAHLADRRVGTLSGGQRARVALARALSVDPDVLLLDEPFAALDVGAAAEVRAVVRDVMRGRTGILVTHNLLDVATLADHVVVLTDGRVAESAPVAEFLAAPRSGFGRRLTGVTSLVGERTAGGGVAVAGVELIGVGTASDGAGGGTAARSGSDGDAPAGGRCLVHVRAADARASLDDGPGVLRARPVAVTASIGAIRLEVELDDGQTLDVDVPPGWPGLDSDVVQVSVERFVTSDDDGTVWADR